MKKNPNRITNRDIKQSIYRANANVRGGEKDRNFSEKIKRETSYYTIFGKHDFINEEGYPEVEEEDHAFAKEVRVQNKHPRFLVKRASNGSFYNPLGMDEGRHNKSLHKVGRNQYEYMQVNSKAFQFYLDFLKTKNLAHLRNAERETF